MKKQEEEKAFLNACKKANLNPYELTNWEGFLDACRKKHMSDVEIIRLIPPEVLIRKLGENLEKRRQKDDSKNHS